MAKNNATSSNELVSNSNDGSDISEDGSSDSTSSSDLSSLQHSKRKLSAPDSEPTGSGKKSKLSKIPELDSNTVKDKNKSTNHKHSQSDASSEQPTRNGIASPNTVGSSRFKTTYRPPDGFHRVPKKAPVEREINTQGKTVWHIVAPRSFELHSLKEFDISRVEQGQTVFTAGGVEYAFVSDYQNAVRKQMLLLPGDTGVKYTNATTAMNETLRLQQVMPSMPSDSESRISTSIKKPLRRDTERLQTRHWATGFEQSGSHNRSRLGSLEGVYQDLDSRSSEEQRQISLGLNVTKSEGSESASSPTSTSDSASDKSQSSDAEAGS